jgi:periplasmic protein TonB
MSYVTQKTTAKPAGLTAAIAVNGAVLLAVILSPMTVPPRKAPTTTTVVNVPNYNPPPPDPHHDEVARDIPPIVVPDTAIRIDQKDQIETTTKERQDDSIDILSGSGSTAGGTEKEKEKEKEPEIAPAPEVVQPVPPPIFKRAAKDERYTKDFQPNYPPDLLRRDIEGKVAIRILIGTDGRVRQANIVSAAHASFGEATRKQALKYWRFIPATRGGAAVEDWQTLTVNFLIN